MVEIKTSVDGPSGAIVYAPYVNGKFVGDYTDPEEMGRDLKVLVGAPKQKEIAPVDVRLVEG